jgi:hypothetical protein
MCTLGKHFSLKATNMVNFTALFTPMDLSEFLSPPYSYTFALFTKFFCNENEDISPIILNFYMNLSYHTVPCFRRE